MNMALSIASNASLDFHRQTWWDDLLGVYANTSVGVGLGGGAGLGGMGERIDRDVAYVL